MKRAAIAAGIVTGATVPLLVMTVWLFGCCVLPFHHVMHRLMPVCAMAADLLRGGDAQPATPAPAKREPVKRVVSETARAFRVASIDASDEVVTPRAAAHRTFIAHGALRCDRDVGLHVLVATFRI
ncbi:MAG TPA: hypothetical protein VN181_07205 [Thermoanaerobaculia bacterium]|nr:hypothetical protein [Thermoanaerobaculia bacterium]